ncbi:MAG: NAD(P)-dependent alcohol dehydrogenase [Candidatus Bipolaricaulota bacterium]|nr:MAG: NAD(P)-dependent alcohol dehydrogenase [Candidatus Bipolaricaulota bacterium]
MRAIVYTRYGSPDVLQLQDVPRPAPADSEVLIRIHATTVTTANLANISGKPIIARIFSPNLGLTRPKVAILGVELAGVIAAAGERVTRFRMGDQVFAEPETGAFAEYICMPEDGLLALKPANVSFDEAAAACDSFLTAMPFLRDGGQIQSKHRVLINGASASIGSMAVQIAEHFGAEVTGVCSTANLELVKSLGADHVIDYTQEDFTRSGESYDIIFDVVAKSSFSRCRKVLAEDGIYLSTFPTLGVLLPRFGRRRAKFMATGLRPPADRLKDLLYLKELMERGRLRTVIDRRYPLEEIAEAHRYVAKGHKKGNVVITVVPSEA